MREQSGFRWLLEDSEVRGGRGRRRFWGWTGRSGGGTARHHSAPPARRPRQLPGRLAVAAGLLLALGLLAGRVAPTALAASTTITTCNETTLDSAISSASSGDTIKFGCSGDITLSSTLTISTDLTLDGNGQSVTLDGNNSVRVLSVDSGVSLTLKGLLIIKGAMTNSALNGAGGGLINNGGTVTIFNTFVANNTANFGGGLFNNGGTLNITNSTVDSNGANDGGGLFNNGGTLNITNSTVDSNTAAIGGGLYNYGSGTVNVTSSTVNGNSTTTDIGGGLYNATGTVNIANSTIASNSSAAYGGGLDNADTLNIINSTIANNTATNGGGGIDNSGTMTIGGSIVADNTASSAESNCANTGTLTDAGYNLESGSDCGFTGTGSLQNTDPKLDPSGLADNGGPTQTIALQTGSPAIDQIPAASCPATDQRGVIRLASGETACDMGAYETNYDDDLALTNMPTDITVNATSSSGAVVTYTAPTATDGDGDASTPSVSCTPASGSTFAIGTTTVTCTATDSDDTNSPLSASFRVTVEALSTTTTLASSPNPSVVGQEVTYTATVSPAPSGGSISFYQTGSSTPITCGSDSQVLDTAGTATCTVTYSTVGSYNIIASYDGKNTAYASSSTASALTQTVNRASTTTGLAVTSPTQPSGLPSGIAVAVAGKTATFTAKITAQAPGSGTPTGTVTFTDGTTVLCSNVALSSSGTATCANTYTAAGKHSITATYNGDPNYLGSSASLTLYVDTDISSYLQHGVYNLKNINLSGGYFVGENLSGANFSDGNFSGANFSYANLSGANLSNGNFSKANFTGANLTNANLTQTNLNGATGLAANQLGGVVWSKTTCPDNTTSNNDGGTCLSHL